MSDDVVGIPVAPPQPSGAEDVARKRRHDLLNEAMVTAGQLQILVDQVRTTTRRLVTMLDEEVSATGVGPPPES